MNNIPLSDIAEVPEMAFWERVQFNNQNMHGIHGKI